MFSKKRLVSVAALATPEPYVGWARVAALFHPEPPPVPGVHPSAVVDPAAVVDPSAEIGPLVVAAAGATIGPRCRIGPGAVIGAGVAMGADCRIGALASISNVPGNPAGNLDLVALNAITLIPKPTLSAITISESHSGRTDNPPLL